MKLEFTNEDVQEFFTANSEAAAFLVPAAPEDHSGASQFGGLPCLPAHVEWPRTGDGQPMHFLATVDLTELPDVASANELPKSGYLHFFLSVWGKVELPRHAVLYATEPGRKRPPPVDLGPIDEHARSYCGSALFVEDRIFPATLANFTTADIIPEKPHRFSAEEYPFSLALLKYESTLNTRAMPREMRLTGIDHLLPSKGPICKPDGFGGHFPWSTSVAKHLTEAMIKHIPYEWFRWAGVEKSVDLISLEQALRHKADSYERDELLQKIAGPKSRLQNAAEDLVKLDALRQILDKELEHQPLSSMAQAAFDAVFQSMAAQDDDGNIDRVRLRMRNRTILSALCNEIRKGGPLRADCPDAFYYQFRPELFSNDYNRHLVGGTTADPNAPPRWTGIRLLRLDSDWPLGFNFGDCHNIEFWIDPDDLRAGSVDQASIRLPFA